VIQRVDEESVFHDLESATNSVFSG
jgi:hypothetical protein